MRVHPKEISEQKSFDGKAFPLVLSPETKPALDEFLSWLKENKTSVREQLLEYGAILFRGFPIDSPEAFAQVVDAGEFEPMPYLGGAAPRNGVVGKRVLTSNESPPSEPIPFHHEMAQVPNPPSYIFFYCDLPAAEGGATPIVLSQQVYRRFHKINPEFAEKLEDVGVKYVRVMPSEDDPSSAIGRSWRSTFLTDNRAEAEEKMQAVGTTWEWLEGDNLRTTTAVIPAIRTDVRNGQKTFFNSVVAAYTGWTDERNDPTQAVRCGDDTPVDREAVLATAEAMREDSVAFKWEKGDVLFIDNGLVMHSRQPFNGPRRILASIARS